MTTLNAAALGMSIASLVVSVCAMRRTLRSWDAACNAQKAASEMRSKVHRLSCDVQRLSWKVEYSEDATNDEKRGVKIGQKTLEAIKRAARLYES